MNGCTTTDDRTPRKAGLAGVIGALLMLAWCGVAQAATQSWSLTLPGEPGRGEIAFKVTAPDTKGPLPILLFSHGSGYSKDDYGVLMDDWADHGFVVLSPTHLDSRSMALPADDARRANIWRLRRDDLVYLLDHTADIERAIPALRGRLDLHKVLVAGHSYGGHTAAQLLGMTVVDPKTGVSLDLSDSRIMGGVLLAPAGGIEGLSAAFAPNAAYLKTDWSHVTRPLLVYVGTADTGVMNPTDYHWRAAPYYGAPAGAACLITLSDVGHFLGGINGPGSDSHGDKPATVTAIKITSLAWMQAILHQPPKPSAVTERDLVKTPDQLVCK